MLSGAARAGILGAIDRANSAWSAATQSLDSSGLGDAVADQALSDDVSEIAALPQEGQSRRSVNIAFAVSDVSLDTPGHAVVHTRESWYAELYDIASGRHVQRTPTSTYNETYVVEYRNGAWIVTRNDLQPG